MSPKKIKTLLIDFLDVLKKTAIRWDQANPWRQSAILAYYSIFSLPALILIMVMFAGYFLGEESVSQQVNEQVEELLGPEVAGMVETMVQNVAETGTSTTTFLIGIGFLIFGATTIFYQLQMSLNLIWGVVPKPKKAFLKYLKDRLFSFGLIVSLGFLMLISLLLNSIISLLGDWMTNFWPNMIPSVLLLSNYALNLIVITTLFALMFKILPDAIIRWRSVWVGAFLTSLLFALGQFGLSLYFKMADPASLYGAAASIILILIWTSYVAMIILFGAEFTKQWAIKFGHGIKAKDSAELIDTTKDYFTLE
ncbi:MAG: YihY/virulence factor BrkB family protein [Bacteroidetes bacterium]|nr:MAG: YihY/virulence factor BrkB family protein [Bacteroidota bacterium]